MTETDKSILNPRYKSEQGSTLSIVIILVIILGFMGIVVSNLIISENRISNIDLHKNDAFYLAESGVEYSIGILSDSSSWRKTSSDITLANGSFKVNVIDKTTKSELGDTLLATITATTKHYVKELQVKFLVNEGNWTNVMLAGNNVNLSSGKGNIYGNLHSNSIITVGKKYTVDGTITTAPPIINLPVIDWDYFKNEAIAAGKYFTSDIHFKKDDSPVNGIWYTTKNISIEDNNVVVNGSLVAENDLEIKKNNVEIYATPISHPAIAVGNDVKIDFNNTIIHGLVYADHDIILEKNNGEIVGALVAKNMVKHSGNNLTLILDDKYISNMNGVLIDQTLAGPGGVDMASWIEN